jgi:hypothetical protein
LEGGAGLDDDGGGDLFGRGSVGRADGDGDAEFTVGSAFVNAAGRRDVGVIASDGDADVAVGVDQDRQTRCCTSSDENITGSWWTLVAWRLMAVAA